MAQGLCEILSMNSSIHTQALLQNLLILLVLAALVGCSEDDTGAVVVESSGRLRIDITDAPIDDDGIQGVFVTVAEIRVNGEVQPRLSQRTTLDIAALRDGNTAQLGLEQELSAGAHANVEVKLDLQTDANGNSPGCYVLRADGSKDDLSFGSQTELLISTNKAFSIEENETSRLVLDFDLRKSLEYESSNTRMLTFGSAANVNAAVRTVDVRTTGTIEGEVSAGAQTSTTDKLVVYAYTQGSYNRSTATASAFADATTSTRVAADGTFTLAFLEEGDYELVVADYSDTDGDGKVDFRGTIMADAGLGLTTRAVSVSADAKVIIGLQLGALLP